MIPLYDGSKPYNVIMMEFTYTNTSEQIQITSLIPYYISGGDTNGYNCDLLLPFICVNDLTKQDPRMPQIEKYCPVAKTGRFIAHGAYYKYNVANNLNFERINDNFVTNINNEGYKKDLIFNAQMKGTVKCLI